MDALSLVEFINAAVPRHIIVQHRGGILEEQDKAGETQDNGQGRQDAVKAHIFSWFIKVTLGDGRYLRRVVGEESPRSMQHVVGTIGVAQETADSDEFMKRLSTARRQQNRAGQMLGCGSSPCYHFYLGLLRRGRINEITKRLVRTVELLLGHNEVASEGLEMVISQRGLEATAGPGVVEGSDASKDSNVLEGFTSFNGNDLSFLDEIEELVIQIMVPMREGRERKDTAPQGGDIRPRVSSKCFGLADECFPDDLGRRGPGGPCRLSLLPSPRRARGPFRVR